MNKIGPFAIDVKQMDPPNEVLNLLECLISAIFAQQNRRHRIWCPREFRHCLCHLSSPLQRRQARFGAQFHPESLGSPTLNARSLSDYTSPLTNTYVLP